jgi:hypothetical protein
LTRWQACGVETHCFHFFSVALKETHAFILPS